MGAILKCLKENRLNARAHRLPLRQNLYVALVDNIASRLNGRYVESYEFSFLKNGKCIKKDKIERKRR